MTRDTSRHRYPVQLDLDGRRVLVVGAGEVAARKAAGLLTTGAAVTVVAPQAVDAVADLAANAELVWHRRRYRRGEVASYRLAITATGARDVDGQVYLDGEAAGVWVNAADDIGHCGFTLPAVARSGPVSISIGTEGLSPALASWLRRRAQAELDDGIVELVALLSGIRTELRVRRGTSEHPGWAAALDRDLWQLVRDNRTDAAAALLRSTLDLPDQAGEPVGRSLDGEGVRR